MAFWVFCQWLNAKRPHYSHHHIICNDLPLLQTVNIGNVMHRSRKLFGKHYIRELELLLLTTPWRNLILTWDFEYIIPQCLWCINLGIYEIASNNAIDIWGNGFGKSRRYDRLILKHKKNGKCCCEWQTFYKSHQRVKEVKQLLYKEGFQWTWEGTKVKLLKQVCLDGYNLSHAEELACDYFGE